MTSVNETGQGVSSALASGEASPGGLGFSYNDTASVRAAALTYRERGWFVLPLVPGDKTPAIKDWENKATADPDLIRWTWSPGSPYARCGIAIACGPSRLVVIDCDAAKGETPPERWHAITGITDGADVLAYRCEQAKGVFPFGRTFTVATPSDGWHAYHGAPADVEIRNSAGKVGWKIDIRAAGGYVVAAPTVTRDGAYRVMGALDTPVMALPGWLQALCAPQAPQRPTTRDLTLSRPRRGGYGAAALENELQRVLDAPRGQRNTTLNTAAFCLGQLVAGGVLDRAMVVAALLQAGEAIGLGDREYENTVLSGLRKGMQQPRGAA